MTAAATTDAGERPAPRWTRIFTFVSMAVAIAALVVTVWSVGPRTLLDQLAAIGVGFAFVIGLEVVITALDSAALSGFLGPAPRRPSFVHVVRAQVAGRAINAVTPLSSLGEATKATLLMEETASARAIGAVVHYNLAAIGVRLVTIAIGAPLCALILDLPHLLAVALVAGGAVAAALLVAGVLLVRRGMLVSVVDGARGVRLISRDRARRWRAKLAAIDRFDPGCKRPWLAPACVVASKLLSLASLWVVLRSVGYTAGIGTVAAIATAGTLISMLASVVPMGLGISEGSNAALFAALGAPASLGVTMVLGTRVTLLVYAAIGLVLLSASSVVGCAARRYQRRHPRRTRSRSTTSATPDTPCSAATMRSRS